jgi:hypothetical protein
MTSLMILWKRVFRWFHRQTVWQIPQACTVVRAALGAYPALLAKSLESEVHGLVVGKRRTSCHSAWPPFMQNYFPLPKNKKL